MLQLHLQSKVRPRIATALFNTAAAVELLLDGKNNKYYPTILYQGMCYIADTHRTAFRKAMHSFQLRRHSPPVAKTALSPRRTREVMDSYGILAALLLKALFKPKFHTWYY